MYEDMRVKYLFLNLSYPAYVKLQTVLVAIWVIAAAVLFLLARDSSIWLLENGWWLCLAIGILEALESVVAIGKAKRRWEVG